MSDRGSNRQRLGEVLVAAGLLTEEQVNRALALSRKRKLRLGETLVAEGVLTQDQINWALAQHFGLPYVSVNQETLDRELIRSLRPGLLYQHAVIPLVRLGDTVTLAMADPTDTDAVQETQATTGCDIECVIASATAIRAALDTVFSPDERRQALAAEPSADEFARMAAHPVPRQRLGEILIDALLITPDQLEAALARQKSTSKRLGEILIDQGVLTEDQMNWALARHLDVPYIDLRPDMVEPELLRRFDPDFLREHRVVPITRVGNQVCVAMVDPLDQQARAEIASVTGCDVVVSIAPRRSLQAILSRLERLRPAASDSGVPVDILAPGTGAEEGQGRQQEPKRLEPLSEEGVATFKETMQHSPLPLEEKLKVYQALRTLAQARSQGGYRAERAAREQALEPLTPDGIKLALQLSHHVGARAVPALKDSEFQGERGTVGRFFEGDRRFIVDRRAYDRTVRQHIRKHGLDSLQVRNAVAAARAHVLSGGTKQILLISKGEKELAQALTRIIRLARTRERPAEAKVAGYTGPDRRDTPPDVQARMDKALAGSGLAAPARDKVIRAFRTIHQALGGTFDRDRLRELVRQGVFAGFSSAEIGLVERILKIHGYDVS